MDLDAYVTEHRGEWRRLDALSRRVRLSAAEADELVLLYQRVATHLSVVRSRTPDPALVAELSRIVLAARSALTGPARWRWRQLADFVAADLPRVLYASRRWWITTALVSIGVAVVVGAWVVGDPSVPAAFGLSAADQRDLVESQFEAYYSEHRAVDFGSMVWANNAWLSVQCLAAGVVVLPVLWLLWGNMLSIGLTGGVMVAHGSADVFFGLIIPHGLLELTCVFVAAGIGLRLGWSWVVPPAAMTRAQSLAAAAREGMIGAGGLVGLLAVAALLEAFVTPAPVPLLLRDAVGATVFVAFLAYVYVPGRRAHRRAQAV